MRLLYPDASRLADDLRRLEQSLETGTSLSLPAGERIRVWLESIKSSVPLGSKGLIILAGVLVLAVLLLFTKVQWGSLIGPAFLTLFAYRFIRNRKRRLLAEFTKKIAKLPEVKAVLIREDRVTVVLEKPRAKTYLHINSQIESLNSRLFFGKPTTVEIKDDLSGADLQKFIRQPSVVYVSDDITFQ